MRIEQIYDDDLAHSSYFISLDYVSVVIDPIRDIDIYLKKSRESSTKITHIFETHLHADFISGHIDLREYTGADIYGPKKADFDFEHIGLSEGDTVDIENITFRMLETPGHTPEMMNYLLFDNDTSKNDPICIFSGDTLFVGDTGRPDLFPNRLDELTGKLFSSLKDKIKKLPDFCEVYPAHGPGSLCGKSIGSRRKSTIGYEKKTNKLLNIEDFEDFKENLLKDMPVAPAYYSRSSEINRKGPSLLSSLPPMEFLTERQVSSMIDDKGLELEIIDNRHFTDFSAAHINGSINIDKDGSFGAYSGWFVGKDSNIILVSENTGDAEIAYKLLRRVGFDNSIYYLEKGMKDWINNGNSYANFDLVSIEELEHILSENPDEYQIIDVRNPHEYEKKHFKGSKNIPFYSFYKKDISIDKDTHLIVHCSTGIRSSIACSFLKRKGYKSIYNLSGGIDAYIKAGKSF